MLFENAGFMVKAVFVSLDIDESYAVAAAYRLVTGDKLLYEATV